MRNLLIATLLVSASAIAYEILLIRLLSIIQWHHFAWMIISVALLGYGASGTAIALARRWLEPRFEIAFAMSAFAFSLAMIAGFLLGQRLPFNALEIVWNSRQFLYLALMYLVFMIPFFFAASCIGLAFTCRSGQVDRIYFFDLLGAGLGALLLLVALFLLKPQQVLVLLCAVALFASMLILWTSPQRKSPARPILLVSQVVWLLVLLMLLPADRIGLHMSEFKGLSQALQVMDSRVLAESSSPLGLLTVVESPAVPFRHVPGLSFATRHRVPEQLAVFTDGDSINVITRFDGDPGKMAYLGDTTAALPYRLLHQPRVLILGSGAGADVLLALHNGASHIQAVELNPQMISLVRETFSAFSGNLYEHERLRVHETEARGFVARNDQRFDLVQISLLDSFTASGSGVHALNESHLYTIEAMGQYMDLLEPGGLLAITRWIKVPPRDSLKLVSTLIEALRQKGISDPGRRIAVIRNWNTVTLLARNGVFLARDTAQILEFAHPRFFDTAYYPSMPAESANRFNQLDQPWLFDGIRALLGDGDEEFMEDYKFNIRPATDDRPYFFNFFKWRVLPEALDLRKRGGAGLIEWGYLVLVATLAQAVLLGLVLILLPLAAVKRQWPRGTGWRMGSYFALLGLAFLFIEMAFIQKFILFLSHPLYSVAVVLAGFLVFAGLGSSCAVRIAQKFEQAGTSPVRVAVAAIAFFTLAWIVILPWIFERMIGQGDLLRVSVSLALIAPLAFCMGIPFPLGLRRVASFAPGFIPWAWGINGLASVISAALATLLAIEFGFTVVLLLALLLYAGAAVLVHAQHSGNSDYRLNRQI